MRGVEPYEARPTRRLMCFVDGENLVMRYQAMLQRGFTPQDGTTHVPDVLVWRHGFTHLAQFHEILRVTYYTYVVGDEDRVDAVRDQIRGLQFMKHQASLLPQNLTACVFKKGSKTQSGKGVDIQLCVDMLSHVYRGNVDAVLLLSGDGDYAPLAEEVRRNGVQVFLSAFSDGLNKRLRNVVDQIYELDGTTWK